MAKNRDTVCGIFLDQSHAQRAIQMLQSAGFQANIAGQGNNNAWQGFGNDERSLYESRANEGNAIVTVQNAGNRGEEAINIMLEAGAENIEMQEQGGASASSSSGHAHNAAYYQNLNQNERQYGQVDTNSGRGRNADELRVQLREEELIANKTAQQAGEVQLRKTVREEEREIPVNLRHEEVTIERHAVNRPLGEGEITGDMQNEVINVPIYEEQAQLQKQGRVAEEVIINKDVVQEQQTLRGSVRKEDIEVDQQGSITQRGHNDSNYNQR